MALINTTGFTKGFTKLGGAIVTTVMPVANVIEMMTASSEAWTLDHAANLSAKTERKAVVREQTNDDLMARALADAQLRALETKEYIRSIQTNVGIDSIKVQIHTIKLNAIVNMDASSIAKLVTKSNLSDADILKAANVGSVASTEETSSSPYDLSTFTQAEELPTA